MYKNAGWPGGLLVLTIGSSSSSFSNCLCFEGRGRRDKTLTPSPGFNHAQHKRRPPKIPWTKHLARPKVENKKAEKLNTSPAQQVAAFLDQFDPKVAQVMRQCRTEMRKLLPAANELVYDNYNFFVIGYATTERASDCLVSIASAANGVILSFYNGASLPDPAKLLLGNGKQNRFIRLPTTAPFKSPEVFKLIRTAAAKAKTPLPNKGGGQTIIKSISAKQRPRRRAKGENKLDKK